IGMGKCQALELINDMLEFDRIGLQEIPARRNVVEQILYTDTSSLFTGNWFLLLYLRSFNHNTGAQFVCGKSRSHFHLRHGSNRREGFTAKTFCLQREEILSRSDLRGRMTLQTHSSISLRHTGTVVNNLDQCLTCLLYDECY